MVKTRPSHLPLNGIITDEGHYFHHTFAQQLNEEELQALNQHGLCCGPIRKRFTKEEDDIIQKNWEQFASQQNLNVQHGRLAVINSSRLADKNLFGNVNFSNFCPTICKGLPHRSAYQVRRRLYEIYDPSIRSGSDRLVYNTYMRDLMLSVDQLSQVDVYLAKGLSWLQIGEVLGKASKRCKREHSKWYARNTQISRKMWLTLWELAVSPNKDCDSSNEQTALKMFKTYCFASDVDEKALNSVVDVLDIQRHAERLEKTEIAVRNTWMIILPKLRQSAQNLREKSNCLSDELLFSRAVEESIKFSTLLSFDHLTKFLKIILKATSADKTTSALDSRFYEIPYIEARMKKLGVTGFYCGYLSEVMYMFQTMIYILYRCQRVIFSLFRRKYYLKERLSILSQALEIQWDHFHKDEDPHDAQIVDFTEYTDEKMPMKRRKYIHVRTDAFLDALVSFTVRKDPKWIPPTKLQNYMIRPETKALFPKKKNNSALVEKTRSKRDSE